MSDPLTPLIARLTHLHHLASQAAPGRDTLHETFLQAHEQFKTQVLPWAADWPAAQPALTEMTRSFRLAGLEVGRLQIARQPGGVAQYQQQLIQSVQRLLGFCQSLATVTAEMPPRPPAPPEP